MSGSPTKEILAALRAVGDAQEATRREVVAARALVSEYREAQIRSEGRADLLDVRIATLADRVGAPAPLSGTVELNRDYRVQVMAVVAILTFVAGLGIGACP